MLEKLRELGIRDDLIDEIKNFRESYPAEKSYEERIPKLEQFYYGKDVWEQAITAILCGQNLLLVGHKATGKNLFAENLAGVFMRPRWDVSFHVNMDAASLIGMDTFRGGEVTFRPGPVYTAAKTGGFTVLDEINMAKSEAMAVLHATLDFRRTIDVPGYERIELHPATRFIATMNYGYSGTKELNEALDVTFCRHSDADDCQRKPDKTDKKELSGNPGRCGRRVSSIIFRFTEKNVKMLRFF